MVYAKFDHWGDMLAPLNFVSNEVPVLVCVPKSTAPAGNWTQELLLTGQTLYPLSYQDSREFSPHNALVFCWSTMVAVQTRWMATPSNTQHTIFCIILSPTVLCMLEIALPDCN